MSDQLLFNMGTILFFIGFVIVFVAVILMVLTSMGEKGKVRGGGAVIIGPFPIVFGTNREMPWFPRLVSYFRERGVA